MREMDSRAEGAARRQDELGLSIDRLTRAKIMSSKVVSPEDVLESLMNDGTFNSIRTKMVNQLKTNVSFCNGNFETSPPASKLNKTVIIGKHAPPKWIIHGLVEFISGGPQPEGMFFPVLYGVHAVHLGNEASISQKIIIKPGSVYSLTFAATWMCAQDEVLRVSVPPLLRDLPIQTLYSAKDNVYAWGFTASNATVKVIFHNPIIQEDPTCGPLLDAVTIKELFPPYPTKGI